MAGAVLPVPRFLSEVPRLRSSRWYARRLAMGLLVAAVFLTLYNGFARVTLGPEVDLMTDWDRAIPFLPWTWWLYVPVYALSLLFALFAIREEAVFRAALTGVVLCQLVNGVFYVLMPAPFPRPLGVDLGGGFLESAYHILWRIDPASNTFPSSHVAVSVIAWLALRHERSRLAWLAAVYVVCIFIAVHTTKQHFLYDAGAGAIIGWGCAQVGLWLCCGSGERGRGGEGRGGD